MRGVVSAVPLRVFVLVAAMLQFCRWFRRSSQSRSFMISKTRGVMTLESQFDRVFLHGRPFAYCSAFQELGVLVARCLSLLGFRPAKHVCFRC